MIGEFDGAGGGTIGTGDAIGAWGATGVGATVPEVPDELRESSDAEVGAGTVVGAVVGAFVGAVRTFARCVVLETVAEAEVEAVCVAASPAKRPVPASAPASDQLVSFLIRARPASRSLRLRCPIPRVVMTTMVVPRIWGPLRGR